jgi:hypothetical protein
MLMAICWIGVAASIAVVLNLWPRASLLASLICFLAFVSAARDFSGYQSDGMLLEAGFISLFFAPRGLLPGLAANRPPSRASLFLLRWEWFRIYFESGLVKMLSGDYSWRHLTAMDDYYQNGPLPTWIGWYVQQLPLWFHAATTFLTLAAELGLVFMLFLPRRMQIICFFILTPFQIGIILTANYTFLNYLVLSLGFLLLDDRFLRGILPARWKSVGIAQPSEKAEMEQPEEIGLRHSLRRWSEILRHIIAGWSLGWVFYVTTALLIATAFGPGLVWERPIEIAVPFRIANSYGLFAVMTHERYEIEFQGTVDGKTWITYPFRYKPQDLSRAPGIYAPYQPRFDWNLWFASLGSWQQNRFVVETQVHLLRNNSDVLKLFAGNPFAASPPQQVRTVLWQYWFTDLPTKRKQGLWWRRELRGLYAPVLERLPSGEIGVADSGTGLLEVNPQR